MEIPILDVSAVRSRRGCGQTKHQKYGIYLDALNARPDILTYLFEKIDKNPQGEILVNAVDVAKEMGPHFETIGETAVHWGLKFALFTHGIFVSSTRSNKINPKTGEGYTLLRLRRATPDDKLSEGLTRYLEPPEAPDVDQPIAQCAV